MWPILQISQDQVLVSQPLTYTSCQTPPSIISSDSRLDKNPAMVNRHQLPTTTSRSTSPQVRATACLQANVSLPQAISSKVSINRAINQQTHFSPKKAEIESLKIELSHTRTKIIELESVISDKNKSLLIYKEKIKLLETQQRTNNVNPPSCNDVIDAPNTDLESGSLCKCKLRSLIIQNSSKIKDVERQLSSEIDRLSLILDRKLTPSAAGGPKRNLNTNSPSPADIPSHRSSLSPAAAPFTPQACDPASSGILLEEVLSTPESFADLDFDFTDVPLNERLN